MTQPGFGKWQPVSWCVNSQAIKGIINGIEFSPDGRTLLTGSADSDRPALDVASGETLRIFKGI